MFEGYAFFLCLLIFGFLFYCLTSGLYLRMFYMHFTVVLFLLGGVFSRYLFLKCKYFCFNSYLLDADWFIVLIKSSTCIDRLSSCSFHYSDILLVAFHFCSFLLHVLWYCVVKCIYVYTSWIFLLAWHCYHYALIILSSNIFCVKIFVHDVLVEPL